MDQELMSQISDAGLPDVCLQTLPSIRCASTRARRGTLAIVMPRFSRCQSECRRTFRSKEASRLKFFSGPGHHQGHCISRLMLKGKPSTPRNTSWLAYGTGRRDRHPDLGSSQSPANIKVVMGGTQPFRYRRIRQNPGPDRCGSCIAHNKGNSTLFRFSRKGIIHPKMREPCRRPGDRSDSVTLSCKFR